MVLDLARVPGPFDGGLVDVTSDCTSLAIHEMTTATLLLSCYIQTNVLNDTQVHNECLSILRLLASLET